eukprot:g2189.t1
MVGAARRVSGVAALLLSLLLLLLQLLSVRGELYNLQDEELLDQGKDYYFESISPQELKKYWSKDDAVPLANKIRALRGNLSAVALVEVRLVGCSANGEQNVDLDTAVLERYLSLLSAHPHRPHVLQPPQEGQKLPISYSFVYNVVKDNSPLAESLAAALQKQADEEAASFLRRMLVPLGVVDDLVQQSFQSIQHSRTFTLYLLNPLRPRNREGHPVPYTYSQRDPGPGGDDCSVVSWLGSDDRYAWLDLSAGPLVMGPATTGEGLVTSNTLPLISPLDLSSRSQSESSAVPKAHLSPVAHHLMAEMAAFAHKTAKQLLVPDITRAVPPYTRKLVIQILQISEDVNNAQSTDWVMRMEEELQAMSLLGQEISVMARSLSFEECTLCVSAYTNSLKSHTSRYRAGKSFRTVLHPYLDSQVMHDWLEHFGLSFWGLAFKQGGRGSPAGVSAEEKTTLPVFLYDLLTPKLVFLDRFLLAKSFPDMVLAVQSRSSGALLDYTCSEGGQGIKISTQDPRRAIMAALLDSQWGIASPALHWSAAHRRVVTDYTWAIGPTPFEHFSTSFTLSFAHRDSGPRHLVWGVLNQTLVELEELSEHADSYGKDLAEVLTDAEMLQVTQRWNVFKHKVDKTLQLLGLHNYRNSFMYVRSARHDLQALHKLVHQGLERLIPAMHCEKPT